MRRIATWNGHSIVFCPIAGTFTTPSGGVAAYALLDAETDELIQGFDTLADLIDYAQAEGL